jgi:outer membrane protein assembly factor BamD
MRILKTSGVILLILSAALLASCSSTKQKKKLAYVERPVELLYAEAVRQLDRKRYDESVPLFEEVERQHPYSSWARRAMLMKAFAHYQKNDYDEAVAALDQFITLHPGNKDAPYAYYLKAMCYYERITGVGRDQDLTKNALNSLTDVVRRYPDTEYAKDARLKLDLTYDHLAGKEMYVGRFYMRQNKPISAINRFKYVINNYQTTSQTPEALHRLVEANLQIGLIDEAREAAAVLFYNYSDSVWYKDTFALLKRHRLVDQDGAALARVQTKKEQSKKEKAPKSAVDLTKPVEYDPTVSAEPLGEQPQ